MLAKPLDRSNTPVKASPTPDAGLAVRDREGDKVPRGNGERRLPGQLLINADDWGRRRRHTDQIADCVVRKTVSSVSAMVFMEDSERAAAIARESGIDAGLHLNFTTPFSSRNCPSRLLERQSPLAKYLLRHRFAQAIFHPGLIQSFEYVLLAQLEEFQKLYGTAPERFDGHHHMHLCANVLVAGLLPVGSIVRRNFSFGQGEKGVGNRLYRQIVDCILARRHRLVDFFGALSPLNPPDRLQRIFSLARHSVVELEAHPVNPKEYRFLTGGELFSRVGDIQVASQFASLRQE
jgi:hypothetical protein